MHLFLVVSSRRVCFCCLRLYKLVLFLVFLMFLKKMLVLKYRKAWSSTIHYAAGVELWGTCQYTSYFFICMLPFNFYFYKKSSIDACGHISQCMWQNFFYSFLTFFFKNKVTWLWLLGSVLCSHFCKVLIIEQ